MLDKSVILTILNDWGFWESPPPKTIPRQCLSVPWDWHPDLVWVVQGVRRCGKSTLLSQIMERFGLNPTHCFFVNFEDPRLSENLNDHLLDQIVAMGEEKASKGAALYFFFDEIQNVKNWERWLHKQVERPKKRFLVITGSNASLLKGEFATALTGRHRVVELFPFDWKEFGLARPQGRLEDYLHLGGFPRVLSLANPDEQLREYFTDIIERDVRRRVAARSSQLLIQIAKAAFESTGSELSLRKLTKIFGTSVETVQAYLGGCLTGYLLLECPYFSFSERKRAVRASKYYPIDTGLHRAVVTRAAVNSGKYLETIVFHFLRRKYKEVFYWRDHGEMDFVVQDGTDILPVQVSWEPEKERHLIASEEFKKAFPKAMSVTLVSRTNAEPFLAGELL